MMSWSEVLGEQLLSSATTLVSTNDVLQGKYVLIYFSAHWCPPCRAFTPKLIEFYNEAKDNANPFEIIFCSSDRDERGFREYFASMPWKAIPFNDRQTKNQLSAKFGISGIPALLVFNADGSLITADGRAAVSSDPQGKHFPWKPRNVFDVLGSASLDNHTGTDIKPESVKGKVFGLYFSAHWCGPCKNFTPILISAYEKLKDKGFEVIFVSSDRNDKQYEEYFKTMPWLSIRWDDERSDELKDVYEIATIPALLLFDGSGNIITSNGVETITNDPDGNQFPWSPKGWGSYCSVC